MQKGKRCVTPHLKNSPEYRLVAVSARAHTREIFVELGYREDEIEEFKKMGCSVKGLERTRDMCWAPSERQLSS
jgi:hypothetical protein